jgi:hypothetical protein
MGYSLRCGLVKGTINKYSNDFFLEGQVVLGPHIGVALHIFDVLEVLLEL